MRLLQWLTILGVALIAGGLWSVFQGSEQGSGPRFVLRSEQEQGARSTGLNRSHNADPAAGSHAESIRDFWGRPETLDDHFARHGRDFKARDAADYAQQAHLFLDRAKTTGLPAKRDSDGTLRVFDPRTGAFGAYNSDGTTKTYFKPGSRDYFDRQPGVRIDLRTAR